MSSDPDDFLGTQMIQPDSGKPERKRGQQPGDVPEDSAETGEVADRGGLMDSLPGAGGGETSPGGMDLGTLLGGMVGGGGAQGAGAAAGGSDLSSLLGSLLGNAGGPGAAQPSAGGADMSGLLGSLLGGGAQGTGSAAGAGGLDIGSLLGAVLGGGGAAGGMQGSSGSGSQGGPDLGALLGGLLGGGSASGNSALAQTGLAPAILQAAIPLVLGALMKGKAGRSGEIDLGSAGGADSSAGLAGRLQSGEPVNEAYVRSTGLPEQLAAQTGMDMDSATTAMHKVLTAMQSGAPAQE